MRLALVAVCLQLVEQLGQHAGDDQDNKLRFNIGAAVMDHFRVDNFDGAVLHHAGFKAVPFRPPARHMMNSSSESAMIFTGRPALRDKSAAIR